MGKNRKLKPVSFNLDEEYEAKLYEHATKQTFSRYIKRLIDRDMNGYNNASQPEFIEDVSQEQRGNPMSFI